VSAKLYASATLPPAQARRYAFVCGLSGFKVGGSILKKEKFRVLHCVSYSNFIMINGVFTKIICHGVSFLLIVTGGNYDILKNRHDNSAVICSYKK